MTEFEERQMRQALADQKREIMKEMQSKAKVDKWLLWVPTQLLFVIDLKQPENQAIHRLPRSYHQSLLCQVVDE